MMAEHKRSEPLSESQMLDLETARKSVAAWDDYCARLVPGSLMDSVVEKSIDPVGIAGISVDIGVAMRAVQGCCTWVSISDNDGVVTVSLEDTVDGHWSSEYTHENPVGDDECPMGSDGLHDQHCWAYSVAMALLKMYSPSEDDDG